MGRLDQHLELLDRAVERQHRTLQLSLTGLALLIAFAEQRGDSVVAIWIYGFVIVAATGLLGLWIGETGRIQDLVVHAKTQERRPDSGYEHIGFVEGELGRIRGLLTWAWFGLEGAALAAALLGYHELDLGEATAGPKPDFDILWRAGFIGAAGVFILLGVALFVLGRRRLSKGSDG